MNIMNLNAINFGAKLPVSRVKLASSIGNKELPVDNYVKELLEEHKKEIEELANFVKKDVVIAQRGDLILVNSGANTSAIRIKDKKDSNKFVQGIKNNIFLNK